VASQNGHLPVVAALLDRGADVAAVTKVSHFLALRRQALRLWIWCGDRRFLVGYSVVYVVKLICLALFCFAYRTAVCGCRMVSKHCTSPRRTATCRWWPRSLIAARTLLLFTRWAIFLLTVSRSAVFFVFPLPCYTGVGANLSAVCL
jgi:ankyrin repeat protein